MDHGNDLTVRPILLPKAKSVIWLFMVGGTSHMESFDPKTRSQQICGQEHR